MTDHKVWDQILANRDEARLQMRLASMDAKDAFAKLDARIEAFAHKAGRKLENLGDDVEEETKATLAKMQTELEAVRPRSRRPERAEPEPSTRSPLWLSGVRGRPVANLPGPPLLPCVAAAACRGAAAIPSVAPALRHGSCLRARRRGRAVSARSDSHAIAGRSGSTDRRLR